MRRELPPPPSKPRTSVASLLDELPAPAPPAPASRAPEGRPTFVNVRLSAGQRAVLEGLAKERNRPLRHVAQDLIEQAVRMLGADTESRALWIVLTPEQRAALERRASDDERTPEQMLQRLVRPVLAALEVPDAAE